MDASYHNNNNANNNNYNSNANAYTSHSVYGGGTSIGGVGAGGAKGKLSYYIFFVYITLYYFRQCGPFDSLLFQLNSLFSI